MKTGISDAIMVLVAVELIVPFVYYDFYHHNNGTITYVAHTMCQANTTALRGVMAVNFMRQCGECVGWD